MSVDMSDHPLFDVALEAAVGFTPPHMDPETTLLKVKDVQHLLALAWLQGLSWGVVHPQEAVTGTMNLSEQMKAEKRDHKPGETDG